MLNRLVPLGQRRGCQSSLKKLASDVGRRTTARKPAPARQIDRLKRRRRVFSAAAIEFYLIQEIAATVLRGAMPASDWQASIRKVELPSTLDSSGAGRGDGEKESLGHVH